jgi:hypothetical protein
VLVLSEKTENRFFKRDPYKPDRVNHPTSAPSTPMLFLAQPNKLIAIDNFSAALQVMRFRVWFVMADWHAYIGNSNNFIFSF